jgi:hypothetical protein
VRLFTLKEEADMVPFLVLVTATLALRVAGIVGGAASAPKGLSTGIVRLWLEPLLTAPYYLGGRHAGSASRHNSARLTMRLRG